MFARKKRHKEKITIDTLIQKLKEAKIVLLLNVIFIFLKIPLSFAKKMHAAKAPKETPATRTSNQGLFISTNLP